MIAHDGKYSPMLKQKTTRSVITFVKWLRWNGMVFILSGSVYLFILFN